MTTLAELMRRRHPGYNLPLQTASEWLRSSDPGRRADAIVLLRHLREYFPHALPVGNELVLALLEQGREAEALAELRLLEGRFRVLDDEARGRFGRPELVNVDRQRVLRANG